MGVIGIVGREEELGSLQAFVDHARRGPATLVIEGVAGPHEVFFGGGIETVLCAALADG